MLDLYPRIYLGLISSQSALAGLNVCAINGLKRHTKSVGKPCRHDLIDHHGNSVFTDEHYIANTETAAIFPSRLLRYATKGNIAAVTVFQSPYFSAQPEQPAALQADLLHSATVKRLKNLDKIADYEFQGGSSNLSGRATLRPIGRSEPGKSRATRSFARFLRRHIANESIALHRAGRQHHVMARMVHPFGHHPDKPQRLDLLQTKWGFGRHVDVYAVRCRRSVHMPFGVSPAIATCIMTIR